MSIKTDSRLITIWKRYQIPITVFVLAIIPPAFFYSRAISRLFVLVLIFAILASALNIVFGHTDQLFLFIGALAGLSAYGTALTADWLGISAWLTLLFGASIAGITGLAVSYVSARLEFNVILISILTLALQFALIEVFVGARGITGGSTGFRFSGLALASVEEVLGVQYAEFYILYYILLVLLAGVLIFYEWLRSSKYGIAFNAIRQDELAAKAIGINVVRYRTIAGFISAFIIGLVGPFYAQLEGAIFPGLFEFTQIDVMVLIILVIGGIRTLLGPIVGAGAIIFLNEELQEFGQWRVVLFGFLLIVLFLYFRRGIVPYVDKLILGEQKVRKRISRMLTRS